LKSSLAVPRLPRPAGQRPDRHGPARWRIMKIKRISPNDGSHSASESLMIRVSRLPRRDSWPTPTLSRSQSLPSQVIQVAAFRVQVDRAEVPQCQCSSYCHEPVGESIIVYITLYRGRQVTGSSSSTLRPGPGTVTTALTGSARRGRGCGRRIAILELSPSPWYVSEH
jgi:hypothetical protein